MAYDVIVLGGGPGGYMAAEKSGKAGLSTVCIEGRAYGGTCLNEGCIPTKALLYSGKMYLHAKEAAAFGVHAENVTIDNAAVIDRKNKVVKTLVSGVEATLKAHKVEMVKEYGKITGKTAEGYTVEAGGKTYEGKNLIIATGSVTSIIPIPGVKEGLASGYVLTNRELLDLKELPKKLVVLGGGVIGLEMATYYAMVGVETVIIEMLDHIAGTTDKDMSKELMKICGKMGMKFILGAKVTEVKGDRVVYEKDGQISEELTDKVLLSIGRRANTDGIGLETIGVETNRGAVVTDEFMKTNVPNVYAVGDVNAKIMLAHVAYREADVAVNTICGIPDRMRYDAVPSVIYTLPELSSVGETEESAKAKGLDVKVVRLPMIYSGRYLVENPGENGFMKLVFNKKYGTLIGAQFLCNYSSEFIATCAAFIEMEFTADDMKQVILPHPTVAEIIRDAASAY
ncbi:MAG: dihydrolipoyl dehydrogenase [Eubacterium sp.]|nr:dihydrolipoyl dehydrogenase [Eubacterium sp.]